jgi:glycosyltransferase involved in cell wall biosynthesis
LSRAFPYTSTPRLRVIVPAKNEAQTIPATLDALRCQIDRSGHPLEPTSFDVTVLANNCDDDTAGVVRDYSSRYPTFQLRVLERQFPPEHANIGTVRRTLFDEACKRFEAERIDGIVASTDADTSVAPEWIAANMEALAQGADAVGGRILLSQEERHSMEPMLRTLHLRDTSYRILLSNLEALVDPQPSDPFPRHHQHFGASLAVRVSTYRRAGGIPRVVTLEDMAFYQQLVRIDARVRHSPHVRVTTSGRRDGRVPIGLSTQLVEWEAAAENGIPRTEEPAARSLKRMQLVYARRSAWLRHGPCDGFETFGSYLSAVSDEIEDEVQRAVPFTPVPLEAVIQELREEVARRSKRSSR